MKAENKTIDIVTAASQIFFKITLQGFFGGENSDAKVEQRINGVSTMLPLGHALIRMQELGGKRQF